MRHILCLLFAMMSVTAFAAEAPLDTAKIEQLTGVKGAMNEQEKVFKVSVPRTDVKVTIDQNAMPPFMGLTSWAAFQTDPKGGVMVMGDLVLFQDEVNPVMSALLENGLEVTALHNHFFFESPRIFYMHVQGHGKPADLARMVKPAVDLIGADSPRHQGSVTGTQGNISAGKLDTAKIVEIVGHEGEQSGPVYKITVGRDDLHVREMGAPINARMGLNTWAAFFGSDSNAEIAGDVAMLGPEVTPVLKALRASGLNVVAIHNHMIGGQPAIYFLHYWGSGPAAKLAGGFKAALGELGKQRAGAAKGR